MSEQPQPPASAKEAWHRLLAPRKGRTGQGAQVVVAILCLVLGFALATQVQSTRSTAGGLAGARQDDLVGILADLADRSERLRDEIGDLQRARDRLAAGPGSSAAAVKVARDRAELLGILAGTVGATGPGIIVTVHDPAGAVPASTLLGAIEELRDAGAEAMTIGGTPGSGQPTVRVVVSSYILDSARGGLIVDGKRIRPPYRVVAIGDPRTLAAALAIPGGVIETVQRSGRATGTVHQSKKLSITVLRPLSRPEYARPASGD